MTNMGLPCLGPLEVRMSTCFKTHIFRPRSSRCPERQSIEIRNVNSVDLAWRRLAVAIVAVAQAAAITQLLPAPAFADSENFTINVRPTEGDPEDEAYFQTVPQGLDSNDQKPKGPRLGSLLEGPKGKEVQQCTRKCVPTCIRGGQGAPGLGPMSVRKPVVVFKEGYRTRQYCLSECIQVCSLQMNPAKIAPAVEAQAPP